MNSSLHLLFPTPILIVDIPKIPEDDHEFLLNSEYSYSGREQGQFEKSKDTYILKNRNTELTRWIQEQIDLFAVNMLACATPIKITQSWCLKHKDQPQQVFNHAHPNSFISGAYYIHAPEGTSNLRFNRSLVTSQHYIKWETPPELIQEQPWNWTWQEFPVQTGRLILFPSFLTHSVNGNDVNNNLRCVLSFNTWFDGPIGNSEKLTELGY